MFNLHLETNALNGSDTIIPAMHAIRRPLFVTCAAYIVRALVVLALLTEAYSFIAPSSYRAAYSALLNHLDEGLAWLILGAVQEVLRFCFKILSFSVSVECAVYIFGGFCGTVNTDMPRDWGTVVYLKRRRRVFASRFALKRDFWAARWCIWYGNLLDGILGLLTEYADIIRNRVVAG
jgi:hypothetical protein